jgi:hypothetical protein
LIRIAVLIKSMRPAIEERPLELLLQEVTESPQGSKTGLQFLWLALALYHSATFVRPPLWFLRYSVCPQ